MSRFVKGRARKRFFGAILRNRPVSRKRRIGKEHGAGSDNFEEERAGPLCLFFKAAGAVLSD